jgi:hypothetical protein
MSLLGQIHSVGRISHAPLYVKGLTYDRLYQQFERPHDALGNRYRNPVARAYDRVLDVCRRLVRPFARIEIVVRIRPD